MLPLLLQSNLSTITIIKNKFVKSPIFTNEVHNCMWMCCCLDRGALVRQSFFSEKMRPHLHSASTESHFFSPNIFSRFPNSYQMFIDQARFVDTRQKKARRPIVSSPKGAHPLSWTVFLCCDLWQQVFDCRCRHCEATSSFLISMLMSDFISS